MDKKGKILLASVLKPLGDVRIYKKFAATLGTSYHIAIAARVDASANIGPETKTYVLLPAQYGKLDRLGAGLRLLAAIRDFRPDLLILHSPELVPAGLYAKGVYNFKLIYDLRENYFYNIAYQSNYHPLLKWPLAAALRLVERLALPLIDHCILAEKTYLDEMPYLRHKATVVENKALRASSAGLRDITISTENIRFGMVGTLSHTYGIREAAQFFIQWKKRGLGGSLHFIGHFADGQVAAELTGLARAHASVTIKGSRAPLAHSEIIEAVHSVDLLLLPYPENKSTINCIPTKMYECLAMGKPMLVQQNPLWEKICAPYQAAIFTDFRDVDVDALITAIAHKRFFPNGPANGALWEKEGEKLLDLVNELL